VPRPGKESRRSVAELLGLRAGVVAAVVGAPGDYRRILGHVPAGVLFLPHAAGNLDFVHVFAAKRSVLRDRLDAVMGSIKPNGTIWVSWPETSGVPTDLTEAAVREEARAHGLVGVKACAIDATWSGLKLVTRQVARSAAAHRRQQRV